MRFSKIVEELLVAAINIAKDKKSEYVTPEHLLYAISRDSDFIDSFKSCHGDIEKLKRHLEFYIDNELETIDEGEPEFSVSLNEVMSYATLGASSSERDIIELPHVISGIMNLKESHAAYYVEKQGIKLGELLYSLIEIKGYSKKEIKDELKSLKKDDEFMQYVTCLNDETDNYTPLIGREKEIERTLQILCRKSKNNPIHIGESGVGKTTITIGLAKLINEGKVPKKIENSKIFSIDLATILAGTQYRGEFEKRFKMILDGVMKYENPIIYIDEIHNIVGAGAISGSSFDASNLIKPYLVSGDIRFIGTTTYDEFSKYFAKSKSLLRRFQNIDIKEPSVEETIKIINGIKKHYESYHNVRYSKGAIEHAVELSDKYINDRFLPDKAIDLIDEAGAERVMNPLNRKVQTVNKDLIEEVLSKICNIPKQTVLKDEVKELLTLEKTLGSEVFGQEEAINELVKAIKMSRAGLNEDNSTVANLLFVGPTGVGKTEVSKVLSNKLGIKLIRFDMSEYMEKHTASKLIGSPAGYVGYEEGGLLTEAISKNPHCILLLDEIEKAHSDIFNILLQMMDYATLTDNKGKKVDFRNVILIMTSNAGAGKVGKTLIGFGERKITKEGISEEVKKIFSPEFRNRLTKTVIFNNLNEEMSLKIIEKQFKILNKKLEEKDIQVTPTKSCIEYIKNKGTSEEYGAREIQRIINQEIKTILVDEILFKNLKKGGVCKIDLVNGKIIAIIK